jgi:hypothetical protein
VNRHRLMLKACMLIVLMLVIIIYPINLFADSGTYKSSKHGDPIIGANRDSNLPRGNCSQCHVEHGGDSPYDFALFAADDNGLCQSSGCHEYEYQWPSGDYYWSYPGNAPEWYNSAHGASTALFPATGGREVRLCLQCHNPHSDGDSLNGIYPSETRELEERGCYSNSGLPGQGCHGLNASNRPFGAIDIYSMTLKSSKHNIESTVKIHSSDWSTAYPYGRESRVTNSGSFSGANRHIECVDCHNPHKAIAGNHEIGSNNIGGALLGGWGVEPLNSGHWVVPTTFTTVDFRSIATSKEYQLCFKCHSYFAFANTPPTGHTDNAREFNPANASYHPVEDTIPTNSYTSASTVNGFIETMNAPWDNGRHDLMTCSDCHGSETSSDPAGPHGSNQPYILKGSPQVGDNAFCLGCHKASVYAPSFNPGASETGSRFDSQTTGSDQASHYFHVTERGYGCRQCHGARQAVPPSSPEQRTPYPVEVGSLHGTNTFAALMNGSNIVSYVPGSCTPTCHGHQDYNAGQE